MLELLSSSTTNCALEIVQGKWFWMGKVPLLGPKFVLKFEAKAEEEPVCWRGPAVALEVTESSML